MSQFNRMVKICKGRKWWTLQDIERECVKRFGEHDTGAALSARLRESIKLAKLGLQKERIGPLQGHGKKKVYKYRLTRLTQQAS